MSQTHPHQGQKRMKVVCFPHAAWLGLCLFLNYCLYSSICTWNLQSLVFCVRFMFSFVSFCGPFPRMLILPPAENAFMRTNSLSSVDGILPRFHVVGVPSAPGVLSVCLVLLENVSFSLVLKCLYPFLNTCVMWQTFISPAPLE